MILEYLQAWHERGVILQFKTFTLAQILEWTEELRVEAHWRNEYLVLGISNDEWETDTEARERVFLVIDCSSGAVLAWKIDDGVKERLADSFEKYLQYFFKQLKIFGYEWDKEREVFVEEF